LGLLDEAEDGGVGGIDAGAAGASGAAAAARGRSESPAQRRPTRLFMSRLSAGRPPARQPLDVESVARASEPCGALLRWLQELVVEHVERTKVLKELLALEAELVLADRREAALEGDAAEAESALARARGTLAEQERALERLQREQAAAQKAAADVARLDALRAGKESPSKPGTPEPKLKPKPRPKPRPASPVNVELEISGTLAFVEQELARLRVNFARGMVTVLEGDPEHALVLPKIADILKDHRGKLKLLIEGHCGRDEPDGTDVERCLAVYQWLVEVAGCPPGLLRIKGRGTSFGMGQCAVPVPIQELVVKQGPRGADLETVQAKPGLYFSAIGADLTAEAKPILAEMAKCLLADGHTVRIEGHIDKGEQPEVAMQRARAVRDTLLDLGVERAQLRVESCKALHPLSRLQPAVNRRVEVHLE